MHADRAMLLPRHASGAAEPAWLAGRWPRWIAVLVVAALCLPVIALSDWFPLDLPQIYLVGSDLRASWPAIASPYNGSGRYFPVYWIFNGLQVPLFGDSVAPYFVVQCIVMAGTALLLCRMLRDMTGSFGLAALLLASFFLSTPIAEALSTLGKTEPLMFLLMAAVLAIFHRTGLQGRRAWGAGVAIAVLTTLAIWTKETALLLIGFAATGATLAFAAGRMARFRGMAPDGRRYLRLLLALVAGAGVSRLPYILLENTEKGTLYTAYRITPELVRDNASFYLQQQPDVLVFGALALVLLALAYGQFGTERSLTRRKDADDYVFVLSLAAMGCAYWLGLQVWRWPWNYYMYVPGALFRLCALYGVYTLYRSGALRTALRRTAIGLMGLATLWAAVSVGYIVSSQIESSRIFASALRQVVTSAPPDARLVLESYAFFSEQTLGTRDLVQRHLHRPAPVAGIADVISPATIRRDLFDLMNVTDADIARNREALPRRGDYLLAFTGEKTATWSLRGVAPYAARDSTLREDGIYRMELVAEGRLGAPASFADAPLPLWMKSWMGYKLYKVLDEQPRFMWAGRYAGGQVTPRSSLLLNPAYGKPVSLSFSAPGHLLPATVRITRDGQPWGEVKLTSQQTQVVDVSDTPTRSTVLGFEVSTAAPGQEIQPERDERTPVAHIALVPQQPVVWTGRYDDGWVGERSTVAVNPGFGKPFQLTLAVPPPILPTTVRITRDGQPFKELNVTTPDPVEISVPEAPRQRTVFGIEIPRSFSGKELTGSADERRMSAHADLVPEGDVRWTGRYADGWIGERATLVLNPGYGKPVSVSLTVPPQILPAVVRISRDGQPYRELNVTTPAETTVDIGAAPTRRTELDFQVSRSLAASEFGNKEDKRRLSAIVALAAQKDLHWTNRYGDGWIGERSELVVNPSYGKPVVLAVTAASMIVPATVRITRNGQPLQTLKLTDDAQITVDAGPAPAESTTFGIEVSRTISASELGVKEDTRRLSVRVDVLPPADSRWSGRYSDGWVGERSTLVLSPTYRQPVKFAFLAPAGLASASLLVKRDGKPFRTVELTSAREVVLDAGPAPEAPTTFEFVASRVREPGPAEANGDRRRLAARIVLVEGKKP